VARKKSQFDYEPHTIHETDGWNNDDPVKLNMTDGTSDPVNDPDPMRHLEGNTQPDPFRWNGPVKK
jgi:hypothetical protein